MTYKIAPGTPEAFKTIACGKQYPERVDDVAWENDRIAFRTYGPALQATGEKAYGCDIWVKCVSEPIVDMRYKTELDPKQELRLQNCARPIRKLHSSWPNLFPIISIMVTDWITIR